MMLVALSNTRADEGAYQIGIIAIIALGVIGMWRLIQWLVAAPPDSEPWSEEVSQEIAKEETAPLCHRCLAPHDPLLNFCPDCGAAVGEYTNMLPYPYVFSLGDTLRLGTTGEFRRSPLTIAGFFALALVHPVFAPIYWIMLLKKLLASPPSSPEPPQSAPSTPAG